MRRVFSDMRPVVRNFQSFANVQDSETLISVKSPRVASKCANRPDVWEWRTVAWVAA